MKPRRRAVGLLAALAAAMLVLAPTTGASAAADRGSDRVVVYYQKQFADQSKAYISPLPLLSEHTGVDVVNLAAVHMNNDALLLNDDLPSDAGYDQMWQELATMQTAGISVVGMIGGAMNDTWGNLQLDYAVQYPRLREFIELYHLDGIDLDIETDTEIETVEAVIDDLRADFGSGFLITMSPVSAALVGQDNLSGFDYDDLYAERGDDIDWFNTQFYCGWGDPTAEDYAAIIDYQQTEGAGIPSGKVVIAALTNPANCGDGWVPLDELVDTLKQLTAMYPDFGGVAGWEYFNSLPGGEQAPWQWAQLMRSALGTPPTTPTPSPPPVPDPGDTPSEADGAAAGSLAATGQPILPLVSVAAVTALLLAGGIVIRRRSATRQR